MKKLFSFIMVALLSVMTLNAATTRIYCKMAQSWWKVDNAAVGCHSWGTGAGTTWPGVRMTPVEGETDMWYIDLDVTKVQNVIFTRVNPSDQGNFDWGAKTKDQKIPTDDKNLFTITSSAVWGDPGCDGEWSKYTAPVVTEPTVTGINITGDKYVGTELTFAATVAGFSADPDIIYEVKAGKGDYEQAQGGKYTPAAAGDYTVKATASYQPEEGEFEEASKEVAFTVTEVPVKEYYLVGWINGANSGCEGDAESFHEEYKFVDGTLTTTFTETSYVFVKTGDNNHWFLPESYVAPAAKVTATLAEGNTEKVAVNGNVEVTFTLTENADGTLTLSYEEAAAPVKYYAKNNWDGAEGWSWLEMTRDTVKETLYTL
ncbi:MAG: hypothetical protein MJZ65_06445, partial [Paludibacteraceae bacterium]|nr:hypothetical protein [Paludibacteraceae bacterium]